MLIFYVGHGALDAQGAAYLTLQDGRLDRAGLSARIEKLGADLVHVIVDACQAAGVVGHRGADGKLLAKLEGRVRLVPGSEVRWGGQVWGWVRHFDPVQPGEPIERLQFQGPTPGGLGARLMGLRVELASPATSLTALEPLLGQTLELWPPGLFRALAH